jgi:hypothetical protein
MAGPSLPPGVECRGLWQKLRAFRFLIVVYGLAAAVASWEFAHRGRAVNLYLDPHANFADTLHELYPQRGEAHYEKAIQATLCLQSLSLRQPVPGPCRQFDGQDLRREIRREFEQALDTRIKTREGLYYHYLQILVGSQAPPNEIDAAYQAWRRNFPLSQLPDPRAR